MTSNKPAKSACSKLDLVFDQRTEFRIYQEGNYNSYEQIRYCCTRSYTVHLTGYFQSLRSELLTQTVVFCC